MKKIVALVLCLVLVVGVLAGCEVSSIPSSSEIVYSELTYDELVERGFEILRYDQTAADPKTKYVDVRFFYSYASDERTKQVVLTVTPYDESNNVVESINNGLSTVPLNITGSLPNTGTEIKYILFQNIWKSEDIGNLKISSITIEYASGEFIMCDTGIPTEFD